MFTPTLVIASAPPRRLELEPGGNELGGVHAVSVVGAAVAVVEPVDYRRPDDKGAKDAVGRESREREIELALVERAERGVAVDDRSEGRG